MFKRNKKSKESGVNVDKAIASTVESNALGEILQHFKEGFDRTRHEPQIVAQVDDESVLPYMASSMEQLCIKIGARVEHEAHFEDEGVLIKRYKLGSADDVRLFEFQKMEQDKLLAWELVIQEFQDE